MFVLFGCSLRLDIVQTDKITWELIQVISNGLNKIATYEDPRRCYQYRVIIISLEVGQILIITEIGNYFLKYEKIQIIQHSVESALVSRFLMQFFVF